MNTIIRSAGGLDFLKGLEDARTRLAYYEEGLLVETAERIIDAMESRGVSRSELARRMRVSPAYVTKILRGHANLGLETLAKLAFALDLKWECILLPKTSRVAFLALTDETGSRAVRTVETATVQSSSGSPEADDYEDTHELRISA